MRPLVETIAGHEVELRLTIDALDEIAGVNPRFGEILLGFEVGAWDWREVTAILGAALRRSGTAVRFSDLYDERGVKGCHDLAQRLFYASMPKPDPDAKPDPLPPVASQDSGSPTTSATG